MVCLFCGRHCESLMVLSFTIGMSRATFDLSIRNDSFELPMISFAHYLGSSHCAPTNIVHEQILVATVLKAKVARIQFETGCPRPHVSAWIVHLLPLPLLSDAKLQLHLAGRMLWSARRVR